MIRQKPHHVFIAIILFLAALTGCRSTTRITDTAQTGSQQLLLSTTVDSVICSIDFSPLAFRDVYLDTSQLGAQSTGYAVYKIREQLCGAGVILNESRDEADLVLEVGMAAFGTDSNNQTFGFIGAFQLPEVNFCVTDTQYGTTQLSMFAYQRESGDVVWCCGPLRADAHQRIQRVLGTGPYYSGNIVHPAERTRPEWRLGRR